MSWWPAGEYRTISLKANTKRMGRGRWWSFHSTFQSHPCLYSLSVMLWLVDLAHWLSLSWWKESMKVRSLLLLARTPILSLLFCSWWTSFCPTGMVDNWTQLPHECLCHPEPKGLLKFHGLRKNSMQTSHICHI